MDISVPLWKRNGLLQTNLPLSGELSQELAQVPGPRFQPVAAAHNAGPRTGTALPSRAVPSSGLARPGALKRAGTSPMAWPEPLGSPLTAFRASGREPLPVLPCTASGGLPYGFLAHVG